MTRTAEKLHSVENSIRYSTPQLAIDDTPTVAATCRPCRVDDLEVPAAGTWRAQPVCAAHLALLETIPVSVYLPGVFCKRCSEPVTLDRARMAREISLYGRQTGICTPCFDMRSAESWLPQDTSAHWNRTPLTTVADYRR